MNNIENLGFKKLSYEQKADLVASGFLQGLGKILKFGLNLITSGGLSPIVSLFTGINEKQQIMNSLSNAQKGEIEFDKNGQMGKVKWDAGSSLPHSTVIF